MGGFSGSLGSLWVEVGARLSNFDRAMADMSKTIDSTIKESEGKFSSFANIGSKLTGIGASLSVGLTAPIAAIGVTAIKASGDFDSAMRLVSARGDITGKNLETLRDQATELGAKTQFSSRQAAEGMAEFAGAGFNVTEIFKAMPGTLNLAAAAQTSVGQASGVVKDLLGQFGLSAQDTGRAVDVLAKAGNESSGTLLEMANSLKYVGPVARAAGLDLEQTNAALIVLDKAGIRGEQAGTALRGMLASLTGPSKDAAEKMGDLGIRVTDASGKMLPFSSIIEQFRTSLAKIPNEAERSASLVQIFGRESLAAANVLSGKGAPALLDFEAKLRTAGGEAERTASVMNAGMGGALERMRGSIETAAQRLGDVLAPTIIKVAALIEQGANKLSEFAGWFQKLPDPIQNATLAIVALAAAIGPTLLVAGQMASAITSITTVMPLMTKGLAAVTTALGVSTAAFAAYTAGIGAAVVAIGIVINSFVNLRKAKHDLADADKQQIDALTRLEKHLQGQGADLSKLRDEYKRGMIDQLGYEQGLRKIAVAMGDSRKASGQIKEETTELQKAQQKLETALKSAAGGFKKTDEETKKAEKSARLMTKTTALLAELSSQLEAKYKKTTAEIVAFKLAHQDAASVTPKLTQVTDELAAAVNSMVAEVNLVGPAFLDSAKQAEVSLRAAMAPIEELESAYKKLGVESSASLAKSANDATKAYETIKNSGTASARDIDAAWVKMETARIEAARAMWQTIPKETEEALAKAKASLEGHTKDTKGVWSSWSQQVSTIITDLGKEISDVLWDGDKSWGEKGKAILKSLGESVTRAFVEPATKAIADLISGALADLIGGKGFGGVLDRVKDLGSAVGGIFGGGSGVAGAAGSAGGSVGSVGGSVGGAAGSAGGAAIAGAVGSIASAISGVIGNFQSAKMETSLNAIEHNTRYSMMYLGERADGGILGRLFDIGDKVQYLPGLLDGLNRKLDDWLAPAVQTLGLMQTDLYWSLRKLEDISSAMNWNVSTGRETNSLLVGIRDLMLANRQPVINVYVNGVKTAADAVQMKMQGALAI